MIRTLTTSTLLVVSAAALLVAPMGCQSTGAHGARDAGPWEYPVARRDGTVETLHGVRVADPYRWMENQESAELAAWIDAENEVTNAYLDRIPEREEIGDRLTGLWNYERWGLPYKEGDRYFVTRNDGLQNQSVLYTMGSLDDEPVVLLDPNAFSADGTMALSGTAVSPDAKYIAYGVSDGGSDWQRWRVRDIETGEDLADDLRWVKFSGASWTKDGAGFFYSRYPAADSGDESLAEANFHQKLYYHRVGTPQSQDELVYERPDNPRMGFAAKVSEDGRYVLISVWEGSSRNNRYYYKVRNGGDVVRLLDDNDAQYAFVGNDGPVFYFRTNQGAPKGRLIAIDSRDPGRANWRTIIPETRDNLRSVSHVGGRFVASYLQDAKSAVKIFETDGAYVRDVELPGIGSAGGFGGDFDRSETFYSFSSYTTPSTVYRYDVASGESEVFKAPDIDWDPSQYKTEQVFYRSNDGTRVPMFISYKKGTRRDGRNPTYLYSYGGFNIPLTPRFSVPDAVWMEMGGVYAVPNIRGGGEYGKEWHEAGTKLRKQNVFDDFISAAEYLIDNRWTSTPRLSIGGRSNGGLLVGAVMTQRPELFGAALPGVGVMDMLRFHMFTIGWAWTSDYGSPDDPTEFRALHAYSPLHNLKEGVCYPPTMVYTADRDDRVVPAHSLKFAAQLQHCQSCVNPALIRIETRAGHGAGKPTSKRIEEWADLWSFLVEELEFTPKWDREGALSR